MTLDAATELAGAAIRYVRADLAGRIDFPRDRLGVTLVSDDGTRFEVYRETALRGQGERAGDAGVVLEFRFTAPGPETGAGLRALLAEPAANVATPCFAGLSGFRRKLWLAGQDGTEFLELYEWETAADADRFVRVMRSLLGAVGLADAASFDVVEADSVDEYVAGHARGWHHRPQSGPMRTRRPWAVVGLVLALAVGLAVFRRRRTG
jgi:hypothetical protein